jgi:hypothetical protein
MDTIFLFLNFIVVICFFRHFCSLHRLGFVLEAPHLSSMCKRDLFLWLYILVPSVDEIYFSTQYFCLIRIRYLLLGRYCSLRRQDLFLW